MKREDFLKRCLALAAGAACMDLTMACASVPYAKHTMEDGTAVINRSDLNEGGYALIEVAGLPAPLFVSAQDDNRFTAILLKCSHRGCTVQPAGEILECPCHGSRYTHDGSVIRGPAPEDLQRFPIQATEQTLRIRTY